MCCETVTSRDESFFDLSLDIEQNTSLTGCLRSFGATETLGRKDKFFCDKCCSLQEAQKRLRVKTLPEVLVLHLKRFKYVESLGRYKKLTYRIPFPFELKMTESAEPDTLYTLFAVVIHVGSGPHHGHYTCVVRSNSQWLLFDDDLVDVIEEEQVQRFCFGSTQEIAPTTDAGYILFYQASPC
eukprot:TRINITY_DN2100_c0_g1_i1.p1 TRINITY_DN2100_c0_g1~~TRINITY_DN2100_c0_g1_i1.p1  ORF type:complete len:183 (+),score=41.80 TRINITY_DN2100_c0_g1_i1:596-1144(+)